jgi:hypothetical protein
LLSNSNINEREELKELTHLYKEKLIDYSVVGESRNAILYNGYIVSALGMRAIEEYEAFQNKEKRENETLLLAKKSNVKSNLSLIISAISVIVAIIAIIVK